MSLRRFLFFVNLFLIATSCFLFSVEKEEKQDSVKEYLFNFGLTYNSGNTESTVFNLGSKVKLKNQKNEFDTVLDVYYAKGDNDTLVNNGRWDNIFARSISDSVNYYLNLKFNYDKKKDIDLMSSFGLGIQYVIVENKKIESKVSGGLSREYSNYSNGQEEKKTKGEFMLYAKFNINEKNALSLSTTFSSNVRDFFYDYKFMGIMELSALLSKNLGIKIKLVDSYDNNPVSKNIKKNDFMTVAVIEFKF